MNKRCDFHEWGVSEVIGFMIIFAIMVTGIGMVTLYGYPMLQKAQQNAEIKNMERAFYVLQSDINSLVYKAIPYRETNIQVMGGTLSVLRPEDIVINQTIRIQYGAGPIDVLNIPKYPNILLPLEPVEQPRRFPPGEIRFNSSDQQYTLTMENGGITTVWWSAGSGSNLGSLMMSEPRWFVDYNPERNERTVLVNLIQINSSIYRAVAGGNCLLQIGLKPLNITRDLNGVPISVFNVDFPDPPVPITPPTSKRVIITYHPSTADPYGRAWYNFLNSINQTDVTRINNYNNYTISEYSSNYNDVTLTVNNVDRLIVKGYELNIINI